MVLPLGLVLFLKNVLGRQLSEEFVRDRKILVSRACKIVSLSRSQYYYESVKDDGEVIAALQELAFAHPSYGFRKLFAYLRRGRTFMELVVQDVLKDHPELL